MEFIPHTGQDPQMMQMEADAYGYQIKWPKTYSDNHYDPQLGLYLTFLVLAWFYPSIYYHFPKMRKSFLICVFAACFMVVTVANAILHQDPQGEGSTVTGGLSGSTGTLSISTSGNPYTLTWNLTASTDNCYAWIGQATGVGDVGAEIGGDLAGAIPGHTSSGNSGPVDLSAYTWIYLAVQSGDQPNSGDAKRSYKWYHLAGVYSVNFVIPANTSDHPVHYQFIQNGEVINDADTEPGDPQSTIHLTGLTSNAVVTMQEVTYNAEIGEDPLHPGRYIIVGYTVSGVADVSSATPTTGSGPTGPTPTGPSPAPKVNPVPSVPSAPTPSAPASPAVATTPRAVPNPLTLPTGDKTDTAGAKTKDIANAAEGIVKAMDEMNVKQTDNANGVIEAVDKTAKAAIDAGNAVITAINSLKTENATNTNAIIKGLNGVAAGLGDGPVDGVSAPPAGPTGTAAWNPGTLDLDNMVTSKLPVAPTINTSLSNVHSYTIAFEIPKPGGHFTVSETIDLSQPPYATPVAIFRTLCLAILTLGFYLTVFWTVRGAFTSK